MLIVEINCCILKFCIFYLQFLVFFEDLFLVGNSFSCSCAEFDFGIVEFVVFDDFADRKRNHGRVDNSFLDL